MADHASRDQPEPQSFSDGIDKVVALVRPYGRPKTAFPVVLDVADTRRTAPRICMDGSCGWWTNTVKEIRCWWALRKTSP